MLSYAIKRLFGAIPTLLLIVAVTFFMVRLAPGGPFDKERRLTPEVEANLRAAYHLDEPAPLQFARYVGNLLKGDFGPSFQYKDFTVTELILGGFPTSLTLGGIAMIAAILLGLGAGMVAALKQNSVVDHAVMGVAVLGIAVPNFVVAPLLTLVIGLQLRLLPVGGWGDGGFSLPHAILPIVALALPQIAAIARLTRGSMLEVLRSNFIRTARAKGLPERITLLRHAIKAALPPVVSYLGPAIANTITGSVVIEQIFGIPGIGRYFVQAALNRDYTLVMGVVVFYGALIIFLNLLADLVYGLLDPQVRYD
ncbi:MAG: oligopeptide ABC transporter permease OppB [Pseudomonadota bacterium]